MTHHHHPEHPDSPTHDDVTHGYAITIEPDHNTPGHQDNHGPGHRHLDMTAGHYDHQDHPVDRSSR